MTLTPDVLDAAIHGLQVQMGALSKQITTLQRLRDSNRRPQPTRKPLSADARKRIAAAQRQRWKKQKAALAPAKRAPAKRAAVKAISKAAA